MISPILIKIDELSDLIRSYESDTFSSSAAEITRNEAKEIADRLVFKCVSDLISLDTMDGVTISQELNRVRKEKNNRV